MEFHEKLQELRKSKGLTQEELAEAICVSRTAVSKWESGRGYPSIDSLKEISTYFSVTIDDLLSGKKLLSLAEKENKSNIRNICGLLFGLVDVCSFILIVLPLYPNIIDGYVYSVNLFDYTEATSRIRIVYWCFFISLVLFGIIKILLVKIKPEKDYSFMVNLSMVLNILLVVFLALTKETYAIIVAFVLLVIKIVLVLKTVKMTKQ